MFGVDLNKSAVPKDFVIGVIHLTLNGGRDDGVDADN